MQNKWVQMIADQGHAGCFPFRLATGPLVYGSSSTATVNFCTVHKIWTSLPLPDLKGKILLKFLVRYCRKMTHSLWGTDVQTSGEAALGL